MFGAGEARAESIKDVKLAKEIQLVSVGTLITTQTLEKKGKTDIRSQ